MAEHQDRFRLRITVGAVVEHEGKILCVEEKRKFRDEPEITLLTPGGHLEPQESITQGMIREVREETGYSVEPVDLIGIYMNQYPEGGPSIKFAFRARITSEQTVPIEDESVLRVLWLEPEELISQRARWRPGSTGQQLDDYFAGASFPLEILHCNGNVDR